MTIKVLNLKTGERTEREWTQEELDAHAAAIVIDAPAAADIALQELQDTENTADLARKLEDITAYIVSGTPLPVNKDTQKPYAQEWLEKRATLRNTYKGV